MWLKWIRKGPGTLAWAEPCAAAHLACKSLSGTCLHINGCYSPNLMELFSLCNIHSTQLSISKEPLQYTNTRQRHSFCFRLFCLVLSCSVLDPLSHFRYRPLSRPSSNTT